MNTIKGDIPESELKKEVVTESVPCGLCVRTKFFDVTGELVRENIEIQADPKKIGWIGSASGD